jgi:hypothetical protein
MAARLLLGFFLVWLIWCKGAALARSPADLAAWESLGETVVLTAAAWTLTRTSDDTWPKWLNSAAGPRVLYGLALIAFGASHLAYVTLTASLVPAWLPWHVAWVYLTAATYVAAGIALAGGRFFRPAAALSALQMALFGLLIWLPRVAGGGPRYGHDERSGNFLCACGQRLGHHGGHPAGLRAPGQLIGSLPLGGVLHGLLQTMTAHG